MNAGPGVRLEGLEHIFNRLRLRWPWDSKGTQGLKFGKEVWARVRDWDA